VIQVAIHLAALQGLQRFAVCAEPEQHDPAFPPIPVGMQGISLHGQVDIVQPFLVPAKVTQVEATLDKQVGVVRVKVARAFQVIGSGIELPASRAIIGAMVGLLYGSVLALLSLFLFGGGGAHATSIPLLLSSAPLGVFALVGKLAGEPYMGYGHNATVLGAPLVWAGLGWLVARSGRGRLRLSRILALLHYASGLALVATAGEEPARLQRLQQMPVVVMWATIYLAGQAALWSSMRGGPEARQAIVGAMVGLLYGSILTFLSIFAMGGGHGTPVPFILSSAPFGVVLWITHHSHLRDQAALLSALFVWAGIGWLVVLSGRGKSLSLARIFVLLQYASGFALVAIILPDAWSVEAARHWDFVVMVSAWAMLYLLGQVALWWRLSRRNNLGPTVQ
jgi:hypothetical protein